MTQELKREKAIVHIRTGYYLEFLIKGGRKRRRALVSEMFPCFVDKVEPVRPAISTPQGQATHFIADGDILQPLYQKGTRNEPLTIDSFEQVQRTSPDTLAAPQRFRRDDLIHLGVDPDSFVAPDRDALTIKEIYVDGRANGAAVAQTIADSMVVSDGRLYCTPAAIPGVEVKLGTGYSMSIRNVFGSTEKDGSLLDRSRLFLPHENAAIDEYAARLKADNPFKDIRDERRSDGSRREFTEEAALALDSAALALLSSCKLLLRNPLLTSPTNHGMPFLEADPSFFNALIGLRNLVHPYRNFLPRARDLGQLVQNLSTGFTAVHQSIAYDPRHNMSTLREQLEFVLQEIEINPPRIDASPAEDLDLIAGMGR